MSRMAEGGKLTLGVPNTSHLEQIASKVRKSDRQDMEGLRPNSSILDIIMGNVELSRLVYALYIDGVPYSALGVIPCKKKGTGIPWVVGTVDVDKNPLPFARASMSLLEMLQRDFPVFDTFVCTRNRKSLLWHRWCGFKFDTEQIKLGRDYYYRAVRKIGIKMKKREGI